LYLISVYLLSVPFAFFCLTARNQFSFKWLLLAALSVFVATINIRLPRLSVAIGMGDVFIILILMRFGPGPALLTYWMDVLAAHLTDVFRRYRHELSTNVAVYRWIFNLACCALSVWTMNALYRAVGGLHLSYPVQVVVGLASVAVGWFVVNTGALSLAISLLTHRSFWSVWGEGAFLYLLNFLGSAAVAGLISLFYDWAGFLVSLLCLPIAVIFYQLYRSYIEKYEQAQTHIGELNKLYLQTVDALASAVDAKDRYTHGHIRRVQAYAAKLATYLGINDKNELLAIQAGALLHDIGKIAIPEYILNKPTSLTETEYEKMKLHPVIGANMLSTIEFPFPLMPLVKSHHERWDGNGYPDGLKGEEIPLSARILSLVDCYDALTTNRPYRSPMARAEVIEFFRRESGRAYDPGVVQAFVDNLEEIEAAGKLVVAQATDVWGIKETPKPDAAGGRKLEKVQPTLAYGKALNAAPDIQRELYSVFEFARADFQCLQPIEIFSFMGRKLQGLIDLDAAVFYEADLTQAIVTATHAVGSSSAGLVGLNLNLEQKLTGWVAANNQALCNLPPFPDFLHCAEPRPSFQISAIAPLNRHGEVLGAISLYRKESRKFTEEEFRRLEIIASQTAILLTKCSKRREEVALLRDSLTGLPNAFQLYLMFDQVAMDAARYEYPLAMVSMNFDDLKSIRQKWGPMSADEAIRAAASYLGKELRETDVVVRYASDEFVAISPKMSRESAESMKSRLQDELDHFRFAVRSSVEIPLHMSIGIAMFPDDGQDIESLLSVAEWRMRQDRELHSAVERRIRPTAN
jgi:diguanylate cyclase (GGDEF)-like protein/putative nucleotidyltransferase with HDIG domain